MKRNEKSKRKNMLMSGTSPGKITAGSCRMTSGEEFIQSKTNQGCGSRLRLRYPRTLLFGQGLLPTTSAGAVMNTTME